MLPAVSCVAACTLLMDWSNDAAVLTAFPATPKRPAPNVVSAAPAVVICDPMSCERCVHRPMAVSATFPEASPFDTMSSSVLDADLIWALKSATLARNVTFTERSATLGPSSSTLLSY